MKPNSEEMTALYLAEHHRLVKQIYRRIGSLVAARDLVQDIFLRLWESVPDKQTTTAPFLSRCARNAAIDYLRAEQVRHNYLNGFTDAQEDMSAPSATSILLAQQEKQCIERALALLPAQTRHIFLLNRIHDRSFAEIAVMANISQRAVAKHMAKALKACENALYDHEAN